MAGIIAGVATSHVPAIGAAVDHGKTQEPYWKPLFDGVEPGLRPDGARRREEPGFMNVRLSGQRKRVQAGGDRGSRNS